MRPLIALTIATLLLAMGCAQEPMPTVVALPTERPTATPTMTPTASPMATPTELATGTPTGTPAATASPTSTTTQTPQPVATETPAAPPDTVALELIADGLAAPVALVQAPGDDRLFIADQIGVIYVLTADGQLLSEPFLDLRARMVSLRETFDERGLLGLTFHPEFATNGRFFVYYSAPVRPEAPAGWDHTSHISEFTVPADNPNVADPNSERIIMQVDQPQANHNAGQIVFGPGGYLYIPLGDGGGAHDTGPGHPPLGHGQDTSTLLGSILRINVDAEGSEGQSYAVPAGNPFVGRDGREEIFAYGFRNPFRITFDRGGDNEFFAADAGQDLWEEVSIVTAGGNYGWNIKEGTHCFDPNNPTRPPDDCPDAGPQGEPLIDPVIEYPNLKANDGIGLVVIGGFVYRGSELAGLHGDYIFGDWSTSFSQGDGTLLAASRPVSPGELWPIRELTVANSASGRLEAFLLSFGEDAGGELYVLTTNSPGPVGSTGRVYRLSAAH